MVAGDIVHRGDLRTGLGQIYSGGKVGVVPADKIAGDGDEIGRSFPDSVQKRFVVLPELLVVKIGEQ